MPERATSGRIKVAYLVPPSHNFAGIERVVHEIATGLMERHGDELDVHVVYCSRYDEPQLVDPPYTSHFLDVDRLLRIPGPLRRVARRERFDFLVCPQVEASVLGWVATRGIGLPAFVAHLHGNPRVEERDGNASTKASFFLFRRIVTRRIAAVLAVSPSLAQFISGGLSRRAPVFFAKNPVRDLEATPPGERLPGPFRAVCVARLSRQKGQDILLRALAEARSGLPPVELRLVGAGPMEAELRQLSSDLGLDDIVEFAGYVSDPRPYLRTADCFVLASRWEGFGVALAEALQFGLPLLAADCEFGPSDLIENSRIGDLVATDDPHALAAGLTRAAARPRDPAAAAERAAVAAAYLPEPASESHYEILRTILERSAPQLALRLTA